MQSVGSVMSSVFLGSVSRPAIRLALIGATAIMVAGCSSDMTRFAEGGALGNSRADITPTASIPSGGLSAANVGSTYQPQITASAPAVSSIVSRPLAAPNPRFSAAPTVSPTLSRPAIPAPVSTSSIAAPAASVGGWKAEGGTPIVVAQGENVGMLAARYGVPADALLRVNGFTSASQVQPGARLVVPVYGGAPVAHPGHAAASPVFKPAPVARAHVEPAPVHVAEARVAPARAAETHAPEPRIVAPRVASAKQVGKETLHFQPGPAPASLAAPKNHEARISKPEKVAKLEEHVKPASIEKPGKTARIEPPAKPVPAKVAAAKPVAAPKVAEAKPGKPAKTEAQVAAVAPVAKAPKVAAAEGKKPAVDYDAKTASLPPASEPAPVAAPAAPAVASADSDKPEFRWPARGRVIQGFKPGGNDGINIALPEGTSVKAADGGVVAYAGSELKGYGNLVLIRHPNGFVSAYANNGDLQVKRGETVKRGQTIAKSGQTGNVASPQLHFELRKGSTPVDPTNYLAGL